MIHHHKPAADLDSRPKEILEIKQGSKGAMEPREQQSEQVGKQAAYLLLIVQNSNPS